MTEPTFRLDLYDIVIDDPHRIHIRHRYMFCDWTINAGCIPDRPLALPLDSITRQCAKHDATCVGLPATAAVALP